MATTDPRDASWNGMYRLAAVCALLIVAVALLDIATMFFEGKTIVPGEMGAAGWFALISEHRYLGLRNLGLLNIANLLLELPLFVAIYAVHRRTDPGLASVALLLFAIGASVYISRNTVFSIDALSAQYARAQSPEQKDALLAAGQATLAIGEDLTEGTVMGFVLTEAAGLLMAAVLFRGRRFGRVVAWVGIVGFGALLVFNVFAAFAPGSYGAVLWLGTIGGLLMIAWYVMVARGLFRLAAAKEM